MKRFLSGSILVCLVLLAGSVRAASELQTYVLQCQADLQFSASEVPALNCNDGGNFAPTNRLTAVNDYVVYKKINDNVDLTAACRWLQKSAGPAPSALSVELMIHNRKSGGTCFFSAKNTDTRPGVVSVSTAIVSPTNFPAADAYWLLPTDLSNATFASQRNPGPPKPDSVDSGKCVGCHVEGPYIASPRIAPFLGRYGLLNDGHDTYADMTAFPSPTVPHYHAVGSGRHDAPVAGAFGNWDGIVKGNIAPAGDCSICHSLGKNSVIGDLFTPGNSSEPFLPSLQTDITLADRTVMPPAGETSDYAWINRDNPADGVELETFTAAVNSFPVLYYSCGVPTTLEAHAVGTDATFSTADSVVDKLKTFNMRDGLTCLNSDQPAGKKCSDYAVSYQCPNLSWTPFYNSDTIPTDDGDHEDRSIVNSLVLYTCGGAPISVKAQFWVSGVLKEVVGPSDRLQQFQPSGLICKNSDQPPGQKCSNYVVRYRGCRPRTDASLVKVKNQWVNPPTFTNRFLTTTNIANNSETRGQAENAEYRSQDWIVENVSSTVVRLKDVWSGRYLTASSNNDLAPVVVRDLDVTLTRQQWTIETITGSADVRLRNIGSNRHLTVGNYTTDPYYAPIVTQSLNLNWTSQRWLVQ